MRTWDRPQIRFDALKARLGLVPKPERHPFRWLGTGAIGTLSGAGLMFVFDPRAGRRRRAMARERGAAMARRTTRRMNRWGHRLRAEAAGQVAHVQHLRHPDRPAPNDAALADRVRSQLPRDPALHRHPINVNAENGVVVLRGVVDRLDQNRQLVEAANRVPGVRRVESYLHLPETPPPNMLPLLDGARQPQVSESMLADA
jgi:osmotically-inducible protein OsmY